MALCASAGAVPVLFDFDNAPLMSPLPMYVSSGGMTAYLSGTGQGYSIQSYGTLGIAPAGMGGRYIFPSSVYLSDLIITFSETITNFSILYAPQELNTDSSCRMRATAYMGSTYVTTNTFQITTEPYFWPTGTLTVGSSAGFNKVVVHYDAGPPTGGDYGVIFVADNMIVTPLPRPTVSGQLTLNDWMGNTSTEFATFELLSGSTVVETIFNIPLDSTGHYSFQPTHTGTYSISADVSHWLTKRYPTPVTLNGGANVGGINITLTNGDCDWSGEVDAVDIDYVIANFGQIISDPDFHVNADVDGSGEVDAVDIDIVIANFGAINE